MASCSYSLSYLAASSSLVRARRAPGLDPFRGHRAKGGYVKGDGSACGEQDGQQRRQAAWSSSRTWHPVHIPCPISQHPPRWFGRGGPLGLIRFVDTERKGDTSKATDQLVGNRTVNSVARLPGLHRGHGILFIFPVLSRSILLAGSGEEGPWA